ncbi:aldo/keto reductase [Candidatus Pelagibacter communis]|uniref:aldo/keto reductase n=1 Tax=Pelagibacter ubique TaxID=198252 RepID=UPI00094C8D03|nr:aldo/keto reductase [Candidatus Pelagibacter ubique]|tara:strand:+ start:7243 stop:8280 length:1038 start_codon:yes stop_codon:yes gene_type:complete
MNYKTLGNTDIKVSTICLGTMTWGEQNTEKEGFQQMDYALDQGVNFWDTAELYSIPPKEETFGHTEIIIGNWFEKTKKRDKVILATKVAGPAREYIRGGGNNYTLKRMTEALHNSLKRLKTDYIDLYQLHWPERNTNTFGRLGYEHNESKEWNRFEDVLNYLSKFIKEGKIRNIGLSNETPWGVSKCLSLAKGNDLPRMLSIQNPYSLLNRTYEVGLAEISIREEIGLLGYSPLASGYLTGKYRDNQLPKNSRLERDGDFWTRYNKPNTSKAVDAYYEIAQKYNIDFTQMSLKFCEIQPFMTSVIIGATTMDQLKTNIESVNINLTNEIVDEINEIQKIYPNPCP